MFKLELDTGEHELDRERTAERDLEASLWQVSPAVLKYVTSTCKLYVMEVAYLTPTFKKIFFLSAYPFTQLSQGNSLLGTSIFNNTNVFLREKRPDQTFTRISSLSVHNAYCLFTVIDAGVLDMIKTDVSL